MERIRQAGLVGCTAQKRAFSDCFHGRDGQYDVTGRTRVPLPLFSMRFCAARTVRGRGGDQPSRPAFRASTVRRSSSRLTRQVSSFFRALDLSADVDRTTARKKLDTCLANLEELRRTVEALKAGLDG